jgi:PAS domain S-box-containing protein
MNQEDDFSSLFAPEPITATPALSKSPWKVLLVDDEPDVHAVLRLAAQDIVVDERGLQLLDAQSAQEAKTYLANHPDIALILLDVVMESESAGLDLVRYIRDELGNTTIQIVLITGQPGYSPQREVITKYKIDGYRLKSELSTDKIFVAVCAALRTHQALTELKAHRDHLENLVADRTASLHESNRQLTDTQFAMDRAGIGIHWVSANSGKFLYVNSYAATLLGYTVDEMLSMGVPDIDIHFEGKNFGDAAKDLLTLGTATIESTQRHKDGRQIPVEVTFYFQPGENQTEGRIISFITEISQRKEAEHALRGAKDAAESANQAKSAFLAKMSHEILTPINGILGMTHLLAQNSLSNKQVEQLDKIHRSGLRLLHIVNNLLDLSNIEAKKLTLDVRNFSVSELKESIESALSERALDTQLSINISLSPLPVYLRGDDRRLRQILLNYLDNAVKFTERGSISLNARIDDETSDDLLIRFEVRDTGIGMTHEQQASLFQNFEQIDNSSSRKYSGTGVGLAINKMLAELMGGTVGVSSQENEGSTFWLTVRLARGHTPLESMAQSGMSAEDTLKKAYHGTRLLLAEDDPTNQAVAMGLLQDAGFNIDLAVDGKQAVTMSENGNYALILMDMQMPGMDGVEATCQIRARASGNIPIIAMTANTYADDKARCFAAGMNDFIAKPINPSIVFSTLLKWLPAPVASETLPKPKTTIPLPAQSEVDEGIINRLSAVPGLDVARGISVVRGKTARYIQLLTQFIDTHSDDMDRLAESIASGDHAKAVLLAHSLKGAAATLGIVSLAEAARHIELQQREEHDDNQELRADMDTVRHELEVIGAALPATQSRTPNSSVASSVDPQLSKRLLDDLDERLANDDFTAIALFQEHGETLRGILGKQCDELAHQVRQFDFETARQTLRNLRSFT